MILIADANALGFGDFWPNIGTNDSTKNVLAYQFYDAFTWSMLTMEAVTDITGEANPSNAYYNADWGADGVFAAAADPTKLMEIGTPPEWIKYKNSSLVGNPVADGTGRFGVDPYHGVFAKLMEYDGGYWGTTDGSSSDVFSSSYSEAEYIYAPLFADAVDPTNPISQMVFLPTIGLIVKIKDGSTLADVNSWIDALQGSVPLRSGRKVSDSEITSSSGFTADAADYSAGYLSAVEYSLGSLPNSGTGGGSSSEDEGSSSSSGNSLTDKIGRAHV